MGSLTELCKCQVIHLTSFVGWGFRQFQSSFDCLFFAENPWACSHLFRWLVKRYSSWLIKGLTHPWDRWQGLGPHEFVIAVIEITVGPCPPQLEEKWGVSFRTCGAGKTLQKVKCRAREVGRTKTPQSCMWPQLTLVSLRLIAHRWERWGGREAGEHSRHPALILLKTWARLRGQHLPAIYSTGPEAGLPYLLSSRLPIFEGHYLMYQIHPWMFLCCTVGAVMELFLGVNGTLPKISWDGWSILWWRWFNLIWQISSQMTYL